MQTHPLRTIDFERGGLDDRTLRHLAERRVMTRVVPGVYLDSSTWLELDDRLQFGLRVRMRVERLSRAVVASHWSAAALWGMPVFDEWPPYTEVIDPLRRSSTRTRTLLRRPGELAPGDVVLSHGLALTSPARTAVDLALTCGFECAVMLFDHGLREGLFTLADAAAQLERRPAARRRRAVAEALQFADPKAATPAESLSRASMHLFGLRPPILQEPFFDRLGKIGEVDFFWPDDGVVGEFDGDLKYDDPAFRGGRTASQVVRDEKSRQARLEALPQVRRVARWGYLLARRPDELGRHLEAAGVTRLDPTKRRARTA